MAIWVIKDGQREGPYEEQDVRELIYEGSYSDTDPAIQEGQLDWTTLGLLLNRLPSTSEAAAEPALAPAAAEPPPIPAAASPVLVSIPPDMPDAASRPQPIPVAVIDFEMPFGSMVILMVKWVLASIPALLILGAIGAVFWLSFFALMSAIVRH